VLLQLLSATHLDQGCCTQIEGSFRMFEVSDSPQPLSPFRRRRTSTRHRQTRRPVAFRTASDKRRRWWRRLAEVGSSTNRVGGPCHLQDLLSDYHDISRLEYDLIGLLEVAMRGLCSPLNICPEAHTIAKSYDFLPTPLTQDIVYRTTSFANGLGMKYTS